MRGRGGSRVLWLLALLSAATARAGDEGATIGGFVGWEDGSPLPDVAVEVVPQTGAARTVRTDRRGRYLAEGIPTGYVRVWTPVGAAARSARRPVRTRVERELFVVTGDRRLDGDLVFADARRELLVQVVRQDGRTPAEGVPVLLFREGGASAPEGELVYPPERAPITRADGMARIRGVGSGPFVVRVASAVGSAEARDVRGADGSVTLVLRAPVNLSGVVEVPRRPAGPGPAVPLAPRPFGITLTDLTAWGPRHRPIRVETVAGPEGRFLMDGVAPGLYRIFASTPDGRLGFVDVDARHAPAPDRLRVPVDEGAVLTGELLVGSEPVASDGARITEWLDTLPAVYAKNGRFTIRGIPVGATTHLIFALRDGEGWLPAQGEEVSVTERSIALGPVALPSREQLRRGCGRATGLRLFRRDRRVLVYDVDAESPGARAGVRVGDELVRIAGRQLQGIGSALAECLLNEGPTGSSVTLEIVPASGRLRAVTLVRIPRPDRQ